MDQAVAPPVPPAVASPVVELRQYTLHPGTRERFVDLFQREFVESQEAAGMTLIGFFRDLDDPDRYVWLRGFPDMEKRQAALTCPTHRYCSTASVGNSTSRAPISQVRPERRTRVTGRSVTREKMP